MGEEETLNRGAPNPSWELTPQLPRSWKRRAGATPMHQHLPLVAPGDHP